MTLSSLSTLYEALSQHRGELAAYLTRQRWFRSKARRLTQIVPVDLAVLSMHPTVALVLLRCGFDDEPSTSEAEPWDGETYLLPLVLSERPEAGGPPLLRLAGPGPSVEIREATDLPHTLLLLVEGIRDKAVWPGRVGRFLCTPIVADLLPAALTRATVLGAEQSNTSIVYDGRVIIKLLRQLESGIHPDLEITEYLTARSFAHVPQLVGHIAYEQGGRSAAVALVQEFVPNEGDGWTYVLGRLRALLRDLREQPAIVSGSSRDDVRRILDRPGSGLLDELARLGTVTGELHRALASGSGGAAFEPEPLTAADVRGWQQQMEQRAEVTCSLLKRHRARFDCDLSDASIAALEAGCRRRIRGLSVLSDGRLVKIRQHGDYHLGQILKVSGARSFVVLDFEGEPARTLAERRGKVCPLKDVAGMVRSFSYVREALRQEDPPPTEDEQRLLASWEELAVERFLATYVEAMRADSRMLPPASSLRPVLEAYVADKAAYELTYELNNRPTWAGIPLRALQRLA